MTMKSHPAALGGILAVTLFAAGCAENSAPTAQQSTASEAASTSETEAAAERTTEEELPETETAETASTEETAPEEETEPSGVPLSKALLTKSTVWAGAQRDDGSQLTQVTYDQLSQDTTDYAEILYGETGANSAGSRLEDALSACSNSVRTTAESSAAQLKEAALADPTLSSDDIDCYYTQNSRLYVQRADDAVLSVLLCTDTYSHGAHGSQAFTGYNYDLRTGKALTPGSCFSDLSALRAKIEDRLATLYPDVSVDDSDLQLLFSPAESSDTANALTFTLGPSGVTFWFAPGDLSAYAAGAMSVTFSYEELSDLLPEGLAPAKETGTIQSLPESVPYDTGTDDAPLLFYAAPKQEDGADTGDLTVSVSTGDNSAFLPFVGYEADYGLADMGGQHILLINTRQDDDWEELSLFDLTDMTLTDDGSVLGMGFYGHVPTDADCFVMEKRIQTLGTSLVSSLCGLGEDGQPFTLSSWFVEDQRVGDSLTAKENVPAMLGASGTDPDTASLREGTISKGTVLTPIRTNGTDTVDCITEDGTLVRITVDDPDSWPQTIGGTDIDTLFDGIAFAG
ncbi:MAG: RsiV family protein [Lachnospiraceae bacterium]